MLSSRFVANQRSSSSSAQGGYGCTAQRLLAAETLQTGPGANFRASYQYDAEGRVTDIVYPLFTGDSAHYTYGTVELADSHQVSRLQDIFNGGPWGAPLVKRIERTGGAISRMWYNQDFNGAIGANASVDREYRIDGRLSRGMDSACLETMQFSREGDL